MVKGLPRSSHAGDCCVFIHHSKWIRGCKKINITGDSSFHCFMILWFDSSALSELAGGFNPEFHPLALSSCRFVKAQILSLHQAECVFQSVHHISEHSTCVCGAASSLLLLLCFVTPLFSFSQSSICCWTISDWPGAGGEALLACFLIH